MSDDRAEWFAPKRYGYGAGLPISWQGWVVTLVFSALLIGSAVLFKSRPLQLFATAAPLVIAFTVITARTTRGGWRWRWGDPD